MGNVSKGVPHSYGERTKATVTKDKHFGSGRVALHKGSIVYMEEGTRMWFIYDAPQPGKGNLLYTFQSIGEAVEHIAYLE